MLVFGGVFNYQQIFFWGTNYLALMVVVFDNWGKSSLPHNSAGDLFGMVNSQGCNRDLQRGDEHVTNWITCQSRRAPYIFQASRYIFHSEHHFWGVKLNFLHRIPPPDLPPSSRAGLHLQFSPFRCTQTGIRTSAFFMAGQRGVSTLPRKLRFSRVLHKKMTTTHAYKSLGSY